MKKVSIFLISISVLLTFSMQVVAQNRGHDRSRDGGGRPNMEEFISKRNAYIAEAVGMTAEEAAVFIPLDNELMRKKFEAGRECRKVERELQDKKDKTEEECHKLLKCREEVKEKRDQLDKEYLEKFKKILSAEKILKYERADRDFFEEFIRDKK